MHILAEVLGNAGAIKFNTRGTAFFFSFVCEGISVRFILFLRTLLFGPIGALFFCVKEVGTGRPEDRCSDVRCSPLARPFSSFRRPSHLKAWSTNSIRVPCRIIFLNAAPKKCFFCVCRFLETGIGTEHCVKRARMIVTSLFSASCAKGRRNT